MRSLARRTPSGSQAPLLFEKKGDALPCGLGTNVFGPGPVDPVQG